MSDKSVLIEDLEQIDVEKLTFEGVRILKKRGAIPLCGSGKVVGFVDKEGTLLVKL